jgi:hypothetical protein
MTSVVSPSAPPARRYVGRTDVAAGPDDLVRRYPVRCGIITSDPHHEEDTVANAAPEGRIDPSWPELPDGQYPVNELASPLQGSLSPFGEMEFPLDEVPYVHPVTKINK